MGKLQNRKWKVITSEYIARQPWFTVRHECVELPNGIRVPDYYILEYPDWVNVIAITGSGQFVFISQYRHGLGETNYEIVAGVSEPTDHSMLDAAKRELLEETGYGNGTWSELMVVSANPATQNNLTHCFLATDVELTAQQHLDASEDIKIHLLTLDEVRLLLETGEIKQSLMAAPLWRYMAKK